MSYFDGVTEHGQSFGIDCRVYQLLAETAISLWHCAGVEPVLLENLDGRPGAVCTLYGRKSVYLITVEAGERPPGLALQSNGLDSPGAPETLFQGLADHVEDWGQVNILVGRAEDPDYAKPSPRTHGEIRRAWTRKASDLP